MFRSPLCSEVCFESLFSDLGPRDKAVVHTPQQAKRSVCARCVRNYHVRLRNTFEPTANALTLSAFSLRHLSENSWDTRSDDECFALASRLKRDHKRGLPSAADRRPNDICDRRLGIEGNTCSTKAKDQVEAYCQGYKLLKQIRLYARGLVLMSLVRSLSELFPAHEALHCTLGYSRSVDPEHSEPQDCSSYRLFLSQMTLFFGILGVRVGPKIASLVQEEHPQLIGFFRLLFWFIWLVLKVLLQRMRHAPKGPVTASRIALFWSGHDARAAWTPFWNSPSRASRRHWLQRKHRTVILWDEWVNERGWFSNSLPIKISPDLILPAIGDCHVCPLSWAMYFRDRLVPLGELECDCGVGQWPHDQKGSWLLEDNTCMMKYGHDMTWW